MKSAPASHSATGHPRLADVAAIAGVSIKTASRVINGSDDVATQTVARVKKAADLVGYRSNRIARELRSGALSNLVGMVISDLANPFYAGLAAGAETELSEHGLDLILATARDDAERERNLIESLLERRVRGLIIVASGNDYGYLLAERKRGFSFVFADRPARFLDVDTVYADNQGGMKLCVDYLIAQGCKRIALLADHAAIWTASERILGFQQAVNASNLDLSKCSVVSEIHTSEDAETAARKLLSEQPPIDGIVAANDLIAIGVGHAVVSLGSTCKMISFDDFTTATLMKIPTLDHNPQRLGRLAAETLLNRMADPGNASFSSHTLEINFKVNPTEIAKNGG